MADVFNIKALIRENIRKLNPYSSARDEYSGSASVFLDANENPHNPPLNRYPDPHQLELKKVISGMKELPPETLFLGNGSDEGIDLLFRVLCEPGRDNVITVDPTYGMYGVCAQINNTERKSVLLREDFSLDADAVLAVVDNNTRIIFLCSPNNPTSNSLDRESMCKVLENVDCMVVVDEAYVDFSKEQSMLSLIPDQRNLVVLQTLSKAWGLAGIRLGMVFAHPELIGYLSNIKYPYNVNTLTLNSALAQLANKEVSTGWIERILQARTLLEDQLNAFRFVKKVYPSDANFLLLKVLDPGGLYGFLMQKGIIVRDRSSVPLCEGCIRITVGTETENRLLVEALSVYAQTVEKA
jgi:histidinol-phosphate aminotransferase